MEKEKDVLLSAPTVQRNTIIIMDLLCIVPYRLEKQEMVAAEKTAPTIKPMAK